MTHVYITNRDLLIVQNMVEKLRTMDGISGITIIDCDSSYEPLLEYYKTCPVAVKQVLNTGPRTAFSYLDHDVPFYAVTDGDLDIEDFPRDAVVRMVTTLKRSHEIIKVGASLRIDDLPDTAVGNRARSHESKFWTRSDMTGDYHHADIDTTFAVYRSGNGWIGYGPSLRSKYAVARHVLWYLDENNLPKDWDYYIKNLCTDGISWSAQAHARLKKVNK